jgi:hypothetical protein
MACRVPLAAAWLTVLFLAAGGIRAESPAPYRPGETLTYHFYWGLFMAGSCTFKVDRNDDGNLVFTVHGKSNDFISAIYPVEDIIVSEYDPRHERSLRLTQDRREGRHHYWEDTFFFYRFALGNTRSYVSGENKWFEIPKDRLQDKMSIIYAMRWKDWRQNDDHSAVIGNDKGNFELHLKRIAKKTIRLDDFAPIPAFQVEPSVNYLSGFLKKAKVRAWVSDDNFKVPIRITMEAAFGTITVDLIEVDGIEGWPYEKKD